MPFSTHDVLCITNLLHFIHTNIKLNPNIIFPKCVPSISHNPTIISQAIIIIHFSQSCQTNYPYPSQHMVYLCHHKCLIPKGAYLQMETILLFIRNHCTVFLPPLLYPPFFSTSPLQIPYCTKHIQRWISLIKEESSICGGDGAYSPSQNIIISSRLSQVAKISSKLNYWAFTMQLPS